MSSVGYISRDMTGTTVQGVFAEGTPAHLNVSQTKDISLNLGRSAVESYARHGADLHIVLADGQTLVLDNFFSYGATGGKNLFLSADGQFIEVVLEDKADGMLFASYETLDLSGKWSAYDELVFLDVDRIEPVIAPLAAPLLGGFGAAGVAAAGVVGTAVLVTDDSETGTPPGRGRVPTVDDPDAVYPIAGSTNDPVVITGTGTPGSEVRVLIGGHTETVTIRDDGTWTATIAINDLPPDGNYDTTVEVTDPDGNDFNLDGPTVIIDTTPPEAEVTSGTQSTGDIVNAIEQADGPVITGNGEPGARLNVRINNVTQRTTVNEDGTWSVTFDPADIPTGEYETAVRIRTTDEFGNRNTYHDVLVVDTIAPPIGIDTVKGDDKINFIELFDGVRLTGTGEAGASISVDFQGVTRTTTVANDGTWSVIYGAEHIADGVYDSTISVTSADAAGNNATETHTVHIDTENRVTINTQVGDDHTINASEQAAGVTLTGMADPGATVAVTFQGISHTVTAAVDGSWSSAFSPAEIGIGTYDATVSAVATDTAGNVSTVTKTIGVDTETAVTIDPGLAGGDNIVNAAEAKVGVTLTGVAEPGAEVSVTLAGVTRDALVDASGNWSATFEPGAIPPGEYDSAVTVAATDIAGNTASASSALRVDTVAGTVTISPDPVELDDIINATERADGVEISGTATPGLLVTVGLGTASNQVVADVNGNWSTTFLAGQIPQGNAELPITASIVDSAGNTASATDTVALDTLVDPLTVAPDQTADDIINLAERAAGVTLQGTVEQGSTVQVTIAGVTHAATVDAVGNWSADIAGADLPDGDYTATATITATDGAGNVQSLTESFTVDTSYTTPDVDAVTFSSSDVRRISTEGATDSYTVNALNSDGSVTAPTASVDQDPVFGTEFTFSTPVSDGTHLVITSEDSAQNASSTLVVLEDNATNSGALDHAGLPQFNIDALNLDYASDVSLSLTEADIKALSGNSDTLTVHGGADDTLTVANASAAGVEAVDGQIYNVYTVGDDGTKLLVDQDVNVLI